MRRALLILGLVFVGLALVWPWLSRIGLGRLPGDVVVERGGLRIYVPIVSSILISVILSILLWILRK